MEKILLVDDDDDVRSIIRKMLEKGGYQVIEASNGRQGLKIIEKHLPVAIVTDIIMPDMEGLEFTKTIARQKPELPLIAITGAKNGSYLQVALRLGAASGLYKPFDCNELLAAVEDVLTEASL